MLDLLWLGGALVAGFALGWGCRRRPAPAPATPAPNPAPVGRDVTAPLYGGLPHVDPRPYTPTRVPAAPPVFPRRTRLLLWDETLKAHVYVGDRHE